MKGQIFIITSILVLLGIFLIRINTQTFEVYADDLFFEQYDNLKKQLINTIDLSLINQQSVGTNLNEFVIFSTEVMKQKGLEELVDYQVSVNGNNVTVDLNVSLKSDKSEILERIIINRMVYT